jgi:DNA-directed RNA polymerase specialized sigma24 family protein
MLASMRFLKKFRGEAQLFTWLYRITTNKVSNYYSKENKHNNAHFSFNDCSFANEDSEAEISSAELKYLDSNPDSFNRFNPEHLCRMDETKDILLEGIHKVERQATTDGFTDAFTRFTAEDVSYEELANDHGGEHKVGTIRSRISRTRERYAENIGPKLGYSKEEALELLKPAGWSIKAK